MGRTIFPVYPWFSSRCLLKQNVFLNNFLANYCSASKTRKVLHNNSHLIAFIFKLRNSIEEMANGGILYETTEFYVMIHSTPILSQCQHFLCNNTNEVNMMYHSWAFPDVPFAFETDVSDYTR
eukprot:TRINITY_DN1684_c0_g1_i1.p1 TRINITY_DN1684_c0_g1~~TRINITY_DN1684_c0_g1_i1.p1  ORF type:complete len:123 (-),score=8.24 TRINITY_DN1684_c0_g1_i1:662-1030(-)